MGSSEEIILSQAAYFFSTYSLIGDPAPMEEMEDMTKYAFMNASSALMMVAPATIWKIYSYLAIQHLGEPEEILN